MPEPTPADRDVALRFIYARADILARGMGQAARKSLALGIADLLARARQEGLREAFLQDRHFLEGVCKSHPNTREGNARIGSFLREMMKLPLPTIEPEPAPEAKE